jgi:hypothetical protein
MFFIMWIRGTSSFPWDISFSVDYGAHSCFSARDDGYH